MASNTVDPFFEEEEDLAREQAAPQPRPAAEKPSEAARPPASAGAAQTPAPVRKPPSFALVVGIAVVALLLGVGLGYFWAMSVVDRTSGASDAAESTGSVVAAQDAGTESDDVEMPEGHPDISSMMNPDGTVNQEAVDAYKAQRAAESDAGESAAEDAA